MINLADKLTAKTVEGILADSNEIKYTKEMGDTAKAETVAKELSNITDSMSGLSNSVTALSQEFETTQSDIEQLLKKAEQYTDRFVDNPIANSENAGLMPAADKTKLDSYPSQFVLDLGLVKSQTEGEQTAARSEVAGNRNISFIRFQVQGISALKTSLIMQWPNGINETAQILCTDKAQWRRNVTGATGVKGDPTNAYSWERTAPHYIDYNALSRILQLKDYENQNVSRGVELPLATSTQHGLLSAADKTKLDNYPETPLDISTATSSLDGLMSAADKAALDTAKADITSMQSSKAEKTDLDAAKDEISKNARLIETLESSLESTDEKADTAMRILTFASTVENVNIEEQIISSDFSILYDIGRGCFVALKDGKYYSSFLGSENYNSIFGGVLKPREDRLFLSLDDNFIYHYDGTKLRYFAITDDERTKLLAYPSNPLDIPTATTTKPGLMSAEDKTKLNQTKPVEEVTWTKDHHMSGYTECGEFHIKGQHINKYDGMPILNADPGHTIDATLTVLDSSLSGGTGAKTDACVTQILRISNRTGGDGHVYVRTGQGANKEQLAWGTWEKLMGMFEKNTVDTIEDLDGYTTNGMYSGLYAANTATHGGVQFSPGDTFLIVTVNGYAVGLLGNNQLNPQITQLLYKLPAKTLESEQNAEIYLRTGSYDKTDKVWAWGNFTKMVTNADFASQVANLTTKINQNAANIAGATTTASEALTTAQEALSAATSASENAAQAQELATEAKTVAEQAQGTAANALSEAIEAKSNAATALGAASNALGIADAAQNKNAEQDERLVRIENAIESFHAPSDYVEMTITNEQTQRNVLFWKIEWIDDLTIDGQLINTDGLKGKFFRTLSAGEHQVRFRVSEENRTQRGLLGWADDESDGYLSHVTRIVIPEGWTELPANCFERRKHLEEIVMPSTLRIVGSNCFQSLPAIRELIIPKSVTTINWSAINDCASLKYIRMGGWNEMPLSLSYEAIRNCPALTCIEILPCKLTFKGSTSPFQNLPQLSALICHLTEEPTFEPASPFGNIGSNVSNKILYRPAGIAFYASGYWSTQLCTTLGFTPSDI